MKRAISMSFLVAGLVASRPVSAWSSYQGLHPPAGPGTFCQIDRPHFHSYVPNDVTAHWRSVKGSFRFVGDPTLFGYDGATTKYFHHHPLPSGGYCYIDGPHSHVFGTGSGAGYVQVSGVNFYIGERSADYESERARWAAQTQFYAKASYTRFVAPDAPEVWVTKWGMKRPVEPPIEPPKGIDPAKPEAGEPAKSEAGEPAKSDAVEPEKPARPRFPTGSLLLRKRKAKPTEASSATGVKKVPKETLRLSADKDAAEEPSDAR